MLRVDLIGKRFDKRVVLSFAGNDNRKHAIWRVICDCGRVFTCLSQALYRGGPCRTCSPGRGWKEAALQLEIERDRAGS
jgi:hypothetical protein